MKLIRGMWTSEAWNWADQHEGLYPTAIQNRLIIIKHSVYTFAVTQE